MLKFLLAYYYKHQENYSQKFCENLESIREEESNLEISP